MEIIKHLFAVLFCMVGLLHFIGGTFRYAQSIDFNRRALKVRNMPVDQYEVLAITQMTVGLLLVVIALYVWNW